MPDKFQLELEAALEKRRVNEDNALGDTVSLGHTISKLPKMPMLGKPPKQPAGSWETDFFGINKEPETELSKNKIKSLLDDSDDDEEPLDFLETLDNKKQTKVPKNVETCMTSSDESINESVYSEDDFDPSSADEDPKSAKSVKSVESAKSNVSVKSVKSAASVKSVKSAASIKSNKSYQPKALEKSIKMEVGKKSAEELSHVEGKNATESILSFLEDEKRISIEQVAVAGHGPEQTKTTPVHPELAEAESAEVANDIVAPDLKAISLLQHVQANPESATMGLGETYTLPDKSAPRPSSIIAGDLMETKLQKNEQHAKTSKRPSSAPLAARLQKIISDRRTGKKLPENYRGLGSTKALEDLHRYQSDTLNLEIQGNRGKRKELYLQWLKEKEERRLAVKKVEKTKEMAIKAKTIEKKNEKDRERTVVWEAWEKSKLEKAKQAARAKTKTQIELRIKNEEKIAEKKANEKLVENYRRRKTDEIKLTKQKKREEEEVKIRKESEEIALKRVESAKACTKWKKTRSRQFQEDKLRTAEAERQKEVKQHLDFDQKHSSGRRAYEEWVRRKRLEKAEENRWGSIGDIDHYKKPFY